MCKSLLWKDSQPGDTPPRTPGCNRPPLQGGRPGPRHPAGPTNPWLKLSQPPEEETHFSAWMRQTEQQWTRAGSGPRPGPKGAQTAPRRQPRGPAAVEGRGRQPARRPAQTPLASWRHGWKRSERAGRCLGKQSRREIPGAGPAQGCLGERVRRLSRKSLVANEKHFQVLSQQEITHRGCTNQATQDSEKMSKDALSKWVTRRI